MATITNICKGLSIGCLLALALLSSKSSNKSEFAAACGLHPSTLRNYRRAARRVVSMKGFPLIRGNSAHTTTKYHSYLLAYYFILRCIYVLERGFFPITKMFSLSRLYRINLTFDSVVLHDNDKTDGVKNTCKIIHWFFLQHFPLPRSLPIIPFLPFLTA
ncbi:hypothetical protein [Absidia glauca]|uniref:Ndc10 domain-containing protein n=1 Tax=Absidia glauca TaxID=4829 RepID=A0A163KRX6_ABSGL|nr:hypothetical protein [Absidia glauca]